jgi:hypothetical protein
MSSLRALLQSGTGRWIGRAVCALCVAAFLLLLGRTFSSDEAGRLLFGHWRALIGALGLYLMAYVPMVFGWTVLAESCGCRGRRDLASIFLVSQIAKYLPGNVGQFIGRAYLGELRGHRLSQLVKAMTLEVGGVLAASSLLAAATGLGSGGFAPIGHGRVFSLVLAAAACAALLGAATIFRNNDGPRTLLRSCLAAVGAYVVVLLIISLANVLLVGAISGLSGHGFALSVAAAFLVSWLAGFITPGAPAGLGVREITFYSLLAGVVPAEVLILAAAGFRLVTTAGDLIAWAVGMALRRPAGHSYQMQATL